jgi:hypothetical protein
MLATGRPSTNLLLWRRHANFFMAVAATSWFIALVVFTGFRPGGFAGILKAEGVRVAKKWRYLVLLLSSLAVGIFLWLDYLTRK